MNSSYSGIRVQEWSCQMTWWLFRLMRICQTFFESNCYFILLPMACDQSGFSAPFPIFSAEVIFILQIQCWYDLRHSPVDNHSSFVNLTLVNLFFEKSIYHYLSVSEWILFGFNIDFFASYCWFLKGFFYGLD